MVLAQHSGSVPSSPVPAVPAPVMWRPAGTVRVMADVPTGPARPGLVRRLALWGSGPDGAYLAWGAPRGPAAVAEPRSTGAPALPAVARPGTRARVSGLVRRLALWGAGTGGIHLAWNAPEPHRIFSAHPPALPMRPRVPLSSAACFPSWVAWPIPEELLHRRATPSPVAALRSRTASVCYPSWVAWPIPSQLRRTPQPRPTEPTGRLVVPAEPSRALHASSGRPVRDPVRGMAPPRPGPRSGARVAGRARTRGDPIARRVRGPTP